MDPQRPIVTDYLVLRRREDRDAEPLWEVYRDPAVMHHLGGVRADSFDEFAAQLAERTARERAYAPGLELRVMEDIKTGQVIGHCGVVPVERTGPEIDLVYHLAQRFWGKGYASEAARAMCAFALNDLNLDRIIGLAAPDNLASIRILEKVGMHYIEQTTRYYNLPALVYDLTPATFAG